MTPLRSAKAARGIRRREAELEQSIEAKAPWRPSPFLLRLWPLLAGAALGLAAFLLIFPWPQVFGPADGFAFEPDQQVHVAGIRYFAWDEWRWPLFLAQGFGAPEGTVIVFTDSLPLYALLVRFLRGLAFDPDSNFLALWLAFCYALQGVSAVAAVHLAGERRPAVQLAVAVLALSLPAFLQRFGHAPLCAQGFLLLALGLYLHGARLERCRQALPWALLLTWLVLYLNGYLFFMVTGLCFALLLQGLASRQIGWLRAAAMAALQIVGSFILMAVGGFFFGDHQPGSGFGHYSMNMLSPFLPQESGLFPSAPLVDATGGQYEGFNYLGAGLLLLLLAAGGALWGQGRALLRRHWPLLLLLGGATLLALSQRVYLGDWLLLDLGEAPEILGQVRSSGRFFWLVAYALLLGSTLLLSGWRRWSGPTIIALALLLQLADTQSYRDGLTRRVAEAPGFILPPQPWRALAAGHEIVQVLPPFRCARSNEERLVINQLGYHASAVLTPVSTVYTPRGRPVDCAREIERLFGRELQPGELLVVPGEDPRLPALALTGIGVVDAARHCGRFPQGVVCTLTWPDDLRAEHFPPATVATERLLPAYPLRAKLVPGLSGAPLPYLGPGWRDDDGRGAWTDGGRAHVILRPEPRPEGEMILALESTLPLGSDPAATRELWVEVNGREIGRWQQPADGSVKTAQIRFPANLISDDGLYLITIENAPPPESGLPRGLYVGGLVLREAP